MANSTDISKKQALNKDDDADNSVERGKKAIEAGKKIHNNEKSDQQKNNDEKKDAEGWRNEG